MTEKLYLKHLKSNADHVYLFITGFDADEPKAYIDYELAKAEAQTCGDPDIFHFALDDADPILHNQYFNQMMTLGDQLYVTSVEFTKFSSTNLSALVNYVISQSKYDNLIDVTVTRQSEHRLNLSLKYYSERTIDNQPIVDTDDFTIMQMEIADIKQTEFSDQNYLDPDDTFYEETRNALAMFLNEVNDHRSADSILTNRNLAFDYDNSASRFHVSNSEDPLLMMISALVRHALYDDETSKVTAKKVNDETVGMISLAGGTYVISWYKERGIIDQFNDEDGLPATLSDAIYIIKTLIDKDFLKHPFETYQKVMSEAFA